MATTEEIQTAIKQKQSELKQLEADLPKLYKLHEQAQNEALTASRRLPLDKRMELAGRRQQLESLCVQQEDDIEDVKATIQSLRSELAEAEELERVEQVIVWAKQRNAEGARAFAEAFKHLEQAQKAFGEAHSTLQLEISKAGGLGSERGNRLSMPTHAFTRIYVQLPPSPYGSGRMPLDKYIERLRMHQSGAFKGK
jgi:septal ring factor EnvC (AmiA/AmiB activator)